MKQHYLKILAIALLSQSCINLPKEEQERNLIPVPSLNDSVTSCLASDIFDEGHWPDQKWWQLFESPDLDRLIDIALESNPSLQSMEKRIEVATQTSIVQRSRLYPFLSFDANETWEYLSQNGLYRTLNPTIPLNANLVDLTLSFQYEFDFWGKNRNLFHAALGIERAQYAEYAQSELIVSTALAQTFFALKTNLKRLTLAKQLVSVRQKLYDLEVLLQKKALFSLLPQLLSKESLLAAKQLQQELENEVAHNRHLINTFLGRGPDEEIAIDNELEAIPERFSLPTTLSVDLLARRPDLMAQIWRVESLAHEVGAAKADFYPNINLNSFAGFESIAYSLLLHGTSKTAGLLPAIHLPIFTAGAIRANLRAKKASFDQAVFTYNDMILKSAQEVADLMILVQTFFKQEKEQKEIVKKAQKRGSLIDLLVRKGLDNYLNLYRIQEEIIQRELQEVELTFQQYAATIKLIKALGGGYSSDYVPLRAESPNE